MSTRFVGLILIIGLFLLAFLSLNASAALLTYSSSGQNVATDNEPVTAEKVKPSECDSLSLDNHIIRRSGTFSDTTGSSSLLIGTDGSNTINGLDGSDCLFGGGGTNTLNGGGGTDVCVGGSDDDTFYGCETCYQGGGGSDDTVGCDNVYD